MLAQPFNFKATYTTSQFIATNMADRLKSKSIKYTDILIINCHLLNTLHARKTFKNSHTNQYWTTRSLLQWHKIKTRLAFLV